MTALPERSAFTLIEMLIMTFIVATIPALAFGWFFGAVSHNRLLGTQMGIAIYEHGVLSNTYLCPGVCP